jgi:hypothetical protein
VEDAPSAPRPPPRDSDDVVAPAHRARVYRPQGWLSPVVLVDGRIVGVWSHERRGSAVTVEIEPFDKVDAQVRAAAEAELASLATFLGGEDAAMRWV